MAEEKKELIKIRGANEHNLKNLDVDIPANHPLHLIQFMQRDKDDIWNLCLLTQGSSLGRWRSRM